jgi:hypothetical protein
VFLLIGIVFFYGIGWNVPSIDLWLVLVISIVAAILSGLAVFRFKVIDGIFHKKTLIAWTSVESAEMTDGHISIFLKNRNKTIEFNVAKNELEEKTHVLTARLGNKFTINI